MERDRMKVGRYKQQGREVAMLCPGTLSRDLRYFVNSGLVSREDNEPSLNHHCSL